MSEPLAVPTRVSVRLDDDTRAAISEYMAKHRLTLSQATRVLLALSLREELTADEAFRTAAFREGLVLGVSEIKKLLANSLDTALGHLDEPA